MPRNGRQGYHSDVFDRLWGETVSAGSQGNKRYCDRLVEFL